MTNYQEQILDLIQQKPGIRTIQIVDEIDLDIDIVENLLTAAVRENKIIMTPVIGPNQLKTNSYKINAMDAYWKGRAQAVTVIAMSASAPAVAAPEVKAAAPSQQESGKTVSKVRRALNYLAGTASATGDELCIAMGLEPNRHHPSQYLTTYIRNGLVVKEGDNYKLARDEEKNKVTASDKPATRQAAKPATPAPAQQHQPQVHLAFDKFDAIKSCLTPDEYKAFMKGSVIMYMLAGAEGFQVAATLAQQLAAIELGGAAA